MDKDIPMTLMIHETSGSRNTDRDNRPMTFMIHPTSGRERPLTRMIHPTSGFTCRPPLSDIVHENTKCDGCDMFPLRGIRYRCKQCSDFDLCSDCFVRKGLHERHEFSAYRKPL